MTTERTSKNVPESLRVKRDGAAHGGHKPKVYDLHVAKRRTVNATAEGAMTCHKMVQTVHDKS